MKRLLIIIFFILGILTVIVGGPANDEVISNQKDSPGEIEFETEDSSFSIRFIDVGQADSALVECDGEYLLIDGGNRSDSSKLYSILKSSGIDHLTMVVASHPHEDHVGGLAGALNYATADKILCSTTYYDSEAFDSFKKYADENGDGIYVPKVGETYSLGSAAVSILGVNGENEGNNSSIILKIQYGETSFLFTGDAEREAEQIVLASGADLSANVLKVGHHGSSDSTTYPFLREVMPQYAVIPVGPNNYGHPNENTLSRLKDAGVQVFRTDLQGDIYCTSDGTTVSFATENSEDADTHVPEASSGDTESSSQPITQQSPSAQSSSDSEQNTSFGTEYVLNTSSKKFHYPSCSGVEKMKEKNKSFFKGNREEIVSMGYKPCGECHP